MERPSDEMLVQLIDMADAAHAMMNEAMGMAIGVGKAIERIIPADMRLEKEEMPIEQDQD